MKTPQSAIQSFQEPENVPLHGLRGQLLLFITNPPPIRSLTSSKPGGDPPDGTIRGEKSLEGEHFEHGATVTFPLAQEKMMAGKLLTGFVSPWRPRLGRLWLPEPRHPIHFAFPPACSTTPSSAIYHLSHVQRGQPGILPLRRSTHSFLSHWPLPSTNSPLANTRVLHSTY